MWLFRKVLFVFLLLSGIQWSSALDEAAHHSGHRLHTRQQSRRHRAANDGGLRFEPAPYSKKLELNSSGKIHCKVAAGVSPTVQWFLNDEDPLPDGVTSANGTLMVAEATRKHAGNYTCRATDGDHTITAKITLDVVVSPRVLEPTRGQQVHVSVGQNVSLNCRAAGDPPPTMHWDKNTTFLYQQNGADSDTGSNNTNARLLVMGNGSLVIVNASETDTGRYGCTAGSAAGLDREELMLVVHPEGELPAQESTGVAGKAVLVSISVAAAYMVLVLALMLYCRRRRLKRRQRGEKEELEMCEGREKLVEEGEEGKLKVLNAAPMQNGRLLPHEKDSGADNSEVSAVSWASKKSGPHDQLTVPRAALSGQTTLGHGEFGEVLIAKIDLAQLKRATKKDDQDTEAKIQPALMKVLTTKDEVQLAEFRRQVDMFRIRHEHIARLLGICNDVEPHAMVLEHTDWGDLKTFLIATRTPEENEEYKARVGPAHGLPASETTAQPLGLQHRLLLAQQLASACAKLAHKRQTHRDIATRNCAITSKLQLKLSFVAMSRGPHSHEYYKLHDQVIPLRWLPHEAVLEGEYSTKSDVYMYAATVWEIYTKAELPFAKLNDNSVLERLKSGTLEWSAPSGMPERLVGILKRCWDKSPMERPQFADICEELGSLIKDAIAENASQHSHDKIEQV